MSEEEFQSALNDLEDLQNEKQHLLAQEKLAHQQTNILMDELKEELLPKRKKLLDSNIKLQEGSYDWLR